MLRPFPGGSVNEDLADALTGRVFGVVPASLVALAAATLLIWIPYRRSVVGRAAYAAGSSEVAAYMSGMPIKLAKFTAYTLAGLFAALGGLFLTFYSYTGEAAYASGNAYTLYSIAAVVLGGVVAIRRPRQRHRRHLRRARLPHHRRPPLRLRLRPALAAALPGRRARCSPSASAPSG